MDRTTAAIRVVLQAVRDRLDPSHVVSLVLQQACLLAGAVRGSLIKVDHEKNTLAIASTFGEGWTPEKQTYHLKIGQGITGYVAQTGTPYLAVDASTDPNYIPLFDDVKSELAVPVIVGKEVWAVINLNGFQVGAFNGSDLTTLALFAELVAFALTLQEEFFERQMLQDEIMESQKLAAAVKVIGGIAHELNNPLTTILGQASVLALTPNQPPEMASLQSIVNESQRASRIIRTLLHFSRKDTLEKQVVNVGQIIQELLALCEYQLRVNNIRLEFQDATPPAALKVNREQVVQVLLNLVNNAEQSIAPGRRDGLVSLRAEWTGSGGLRIRVRDNGSGIPPAIAKQIFQPFFSTRNVGQGSGLGLAVGQTLMEGHGGRLYLDSSDSSGSCFVLEFPKGLPAVADTEIVPSLVPFTPLPNQVPVGERSKILVVDDEPSILEFLGRFLGHLKVEVATAGNGLEGLQQLETNRFNVILSDIKMPQVDGIEFYRRTIEKYPTYRQRFVFMSGDFMGESIQEFHLKTGCHVLEKPFSTSRLKDVLSPYLA